jgi:homoaconitase/3-isopropylmalate dehydratase large subunit
MGRKGKMGRIKYIVYKGTESKNLVNGQKYTLSELAVEANISYRCIATRCSGKTYITDKELRPRVAKHATFKDKPKISSYPIFDTIQEAISAKWLKAKL